MLQQKEPEDYVISTGKTNTVRMMCEIAFARVGLDYQDFVVVDPKFYRPAEVQLLLGDCTKAREKLGWQPEMNFKDLIEMMVDADVERVNSLIK